MTPRERTMADIGLIALRHGITRHDVLQKHTKCPRAKAARKAAAQMMLNQGRRIPDIARALNRNHATIYYILDKVKKHGKHASQATRYDSRKQGFANDNINAGAGDSARSCQATKG